jgi:hypothetical protein
MKRQYLPLLSGLIALSLAACASEESPCEADDGCAELVAPEKQAAEGDVVTVTGRVEGAGNIVGSAASPAICYAWICGVLRGQSATMTATPLAGWTFQGWSGCSDSRSPVLVLDNLQASTTCTANFTAAPETPLYTVRFRANYGPYGELDGIPGLHVLVNGRVSGSACTESECRVPSNSSVQFYVSGSQVRGWRECNGGQTFFRVTGDVTCVADIPILL